jgi:hypothetical protein
VSTRERGETEREDLLDRYRHAVERLLGDELAHAGDDDFEALFEHIASSFEDGVDEQGCAAAWLSYRAARGA